jgi:hypothetical protein
MFCGVYVRCAQQYSHLNEELFQLAEACWLNAVECMNGFALNVAGYEDHDRADKTGISMQKTALLYCRHFAVPFSLYSSTQ